ncbi:MAG: hypothetical protein IT385_14905 [Deltaproteobacteria bacterium]|nr:hypothetical protein [Deltaproteobacteria bacterium]
MSHPSPSPRRRLALAFLSVLALGACGDDGDASLCSDEGSIGPGTGAGTIAGFAVAPDGALVTITNLVIFTNLGPIISAKVIRHGPLGFVHELGGVHASAPVVDAQGRVWLFADALRSYTAAGVERPPIPATGFVAIAHDGTLITGGPAVGTTLQSPELVRWTIDGEVIARATVVAEGHMIRDVAIGGDGTVYAVEGPPPPGGAGFRVHALTPGFDTKWTYDLDGESADVDVAVTPEPGIVVGLRDRIVSLDAVGALRWRLDDALDFSAIAVAPDGAVYTRGAALSPTGALIWTHGAPITVAADGTLYSLVEDGLATIDPATGAIVKTLSNARYTAAWEVPPVLAGSGATGCVYTGGTSSLDGIFVDTLMLEAPKATRAGVAAPWGIAGGGAGRTSAAPLAPSTPRAVADVFGFWVRDDGDDRVTLEIAATIDDARAPAGPAYRVWRNEPYGAGEVVQVGGAALADGRLTLTREAGIGAGSVTDLAAAPWTELTLVDPLTGTTATFQRAYRVARPARPSPIIDNAYRSDSMTDVTQTLGGQRSVHAFVDPADGAFWLVQSIPTSADVIEVHRLDSRAETAETARVTVPRGAVAPDVFAGHVDEAGRLVLVTAGEAVVVIPKDPSQPATIESGDDHWWRLPSRAIGEADAWIDTRAIDAAGRVTFAGAFRGALALGGGVRLEQLATEPEPDVFVARLDADGKALWARAFPGANVERAHAFGFVGLRDLVLFDDGGFAAASDATDDHGLVRFDPEGRPVARASLGARSLRGLAAEPSGLLVATGVDPTPSASAGLVAVYDRCARELTWGVPPCEACVGPPHPRDLVGTDLVRAPDGRIMVAAETRETRFAAAAFVAPIVPDGDLVPEAPCPPLVAPSQTLTVTLEGDGSGRVVSDPPGIDCPGACEASFDGLTRVTLTATAAADAWHAGWMGCAPAPAVDEPAASCRWDARRAGTATARFERPARRVLTTTLPDRVSATSVRARGDGAILLSVMTDTTLELVPGTTLAWSDPGAWVALEPDASVRWARVIDAGAPPSWDTVRLAADDGIVALAHNRVSILRWSSAGEALVSWPIDQFHPGDRNRDARDLATTDDGATLVIAHDTIDTVLWRYDADGAATPLTLPITQPLRVFALPDGDVIVAFRYAAAFDFGGHAVPHPGPSPATALARLGSTGAVRWVEPLPHAPRELAVSPGGILVAYEHPWVVEAFELDGSSRWQLERDAPTLTLALGDDGAATLDGPLTRFDRTGARVWSTGLGGAFAVDAQGRAFVLAAGQPISMTMLGP